MLFLSFQDILTPNNTIYRRFTADIDGNESPYTASNRCLYLLLGILLLPKLDVRYCKSRGIFIDVVGQRVEEIKLNFARGC